MAKIKEETIIDILKIFVNNRVKHDREVSEIVVPTSDYDKAYKYIEKYNLMKREEVEGKIKLEKLGHDMKIVPYNERAFLVIGDTRTHKDRLMKLGGRFNNSFTNPETDEKVSGWIFSVKRLEDVKKQLNL